MTQLQLLDGGKKEITPKDMTQLQNMHDGIKGRWGKTWIHSAAVKTPDGKIYAGNRYHEIFAKMSRLNVPHVGGEVGYLLNDGSFMDRQRAAFLALSNGQIDEKRWNSKMLIPEELWNTA